MDTHAIALTVAQSSYACEVQAHSCFNPFYPHRLRCSFRVFFFSFKLESNSVFLFSFSFFTFFGPNWIDTGLFRHISDQIGLYWAKSESGKKNFAMDAHATASTAAWCGYVCWVRMRRP